MESQITYIRNILRKEGITGMKSIDHCIVFILSRMLSNEMCKKFDIDEKFSFENILIGDDKKEIGDQDFYNKIYDNDKPYSCLIGILFNKFGYTNIKFQVKGIYNLKLIYQKLAEIDIEKLDNEYDIIGTIYELHLRSGTSNSMRDLGQYYTHRKVIKYMIELCNPIVKDDGTIETILDPTMGTGGFLTMAVKYLNNHAKKKIDWKKNKDNIIGFDIDDNVTNMARLNVLLETGELCTDTIVKQDTLHYDLRLPSDKILEKVDVILANEPMGLKGIVHDSCCKRIKNLNIKGTKAEPLFLQLFMEALNKDGRCAVIVPDGVLFTESNFHQATRKHLIENFNLKKVISLQDKDFFMNTGVKTSILYFENNGKTKEVEFCEIKLVSGDVKEESILKAKYEELIDKKYSLFVNKFKVEKKEDYGDVKWMKLGDVCELIKGVKKRSIDGKEDGLYPLYYCSILGNLFLNTYDYDGEGIIINKTNGSGKAMVYYGHDKYNVGQTTIHFKSNIKNVMTKYIYYYLYHNIEILQKQYKGSNQKSIVEHDLFNIIIPVPSINFQQKIVEKLDILSSNIENSKKMIEEQKEIMKMYIEIMTMDGEDVKLGDICEINQGNLLTKTEMSDGDYDVIGGGKIIGKHNQKNRDGDDFTLTRVGDVNINYINKPYYLTDNGFSLKSKQKNIMTKYIYYLLSFNIDYLTNLYQGSAQKVISKTNLKLIEIPVPSLERQKEIISYCDNIQNTIDKLEKNIEDNKKLMKDIIELYLKKASKKEIDEDEDEEEIKPSNKNTKTVTKKEIDEEDEEIKPSLKKNTKAVTKKEIDDEDEEIKPSKKNTKAVTKKEIDEEDEEEEEIKPSKKNTKAVTKKEIDEEDEDEEEIKPSLKKNTKTVIKKG
jgi:type I restriction-modification system DNA methylase subunit